MGLRIAQVTTFYPPHHFGGDAHFVRNLAEALGRRGHEVDVICDEDAHRALGGRQQLAVPGPAPGVRVHRLRSAFPRLSCLATQQLGLPAVHGRRIRDILDQDLDVIHFHNASLVGGPGILAYGDAIKLYTTHEHWLVCPTHVLFRMGKEVCEQRTCLRCALQHRRPPQLWRRRGLVARNTDQIDAYLAPSRFCAERHRAAGFPHPLLESPSFLPDLEPEPDAAPENSEPYFLYAGRLEAIKGIRELVDAYPTDSRLRLVIAGTGSLHRELTRLSRRRAVDCVGLLDDDELARRMRGARALIVPSVGWEVLPMVVIEAFRAGTPVIARRLGPLPEMVEETGGGLVFASDSELREALERIATDDELRAKLGKRARRAYEDVWSEGAYMERYLQLIEALATKKSDTRTLGRLATHRAAR